MIEPLLWRPFGWCRLEVDVAGRAQTHRRRAGQRSLRTAAAVGTRAGSLLLGADRPRRPATAIPPRRRGGRRRCAAAIWPGASTRASSPHRPLRPHHVLVPLTKVQSLRHVQGPAQRRLRLATVHLDTVGEQPAFRISTRYRPQYPPALIDRLAAAQAYPACSTSAPARHVAVPLASHVAEVCRRSLAGDARAFRGN